MAAAERIFKLLDTQPEIVSPPSAVAFPTGPVSIEFDHVWFAYHGEDWVLRDVSFRGSAWRNDRRCGAHGCG